MQASDQPPYSGENSGKNSGKILTYAAFQALCWTLLAGASLLLDASSIQCTVVLTAIWLIGLVVSALGARQLFRCAQSQQRIEDELLRQTRQLAEEIAERKTAQEAVQQSEEHLRIVADCASNWEYWRLPDDTFLYMSPSVTKLTGYSIEEFMSDHELVHRIILPEDRELFLNHTHEVCEDGHIMPIEMRILTKNGELRWLGHICRQIFTPEGLPWGWRASNQDITQLKLMEQKLLEQTEQLEIINHSLENRISEAVAELRRMDQTMIQQGRLAALGEMINNIAHQWRQPLNNIGLIIQNIQLSYDSGTITSAEMECQIDKAMDVIMHMSGTIDDFRNFFRDDKEKQNFCINKAVRRTLDFVSAALESRNVRVVIAGDEDVTAFGYQNEYSQVLLNIISNAGEACFERCVEDAQIRIRITRENERSAVYVSDNCGGIPDDVLPRIFDPYFTTRAPDRGTGIGLYMSKVIIEQNMGGKLTARNLDGGAEFRVEV
ncbi:MAG: PAS domain-containing protein [Deltaproteobacteria bacterium]|nr:PAS domain-containing protein [Deltaproteobacteria bacterium]